MRIAELPVPTQISRSRLRLDAKVSVLFRSFVFISIFGSKVSGESDNGTCTLPD